MDLKNLADHDHVAMYLVVGIGDLLSPRLSMPVGG